jgi:hypothetical protein
MIWTARKVIAHSECRAIDSTPGMRELLLGAPPCKEEY